VELRGEQFVDLGEVVSLELGQPIVRSYRLGLLFEGVNLGAVPLSFRVPVLPEEVADVVRMGLEV
jgi:hypothetical protein